MKQQEWTDQLRQRLDNYEEPVPEGLWEDIEQRLEQKPQPGRERRLAVLRRWAVGVAACGLLLIGMWQLLITTDGGHNHQEALQQASNPSADQQGEGLTDIAQQRERASADAQQTENPLITHKQEDEPKPVTQQQEDEPKPATRQQEDEPKPATRQQTEHSPTPQRQERQQPTPAKRQQHGSRFSLQMHTSNLMADNGTSQTSPMLMSNSYMGVVSSALARKAPVYLTGHDTKTEHDMPITVGLSVRLSMTDRLWMSSGINYTSTSSTFSRQLASILKASRQRLHYLGVPVTAGYTFWEKPRLKAYVSVGAELLYNVKAEVSEGHIDRDRLQCSLAGAAGIEYTFLPHLSAYLQPGLRYYPDNGSRLQNIFKERPLQPDLQFGIRYSFR